MRELPAGTVSLLFTDIEGSTRLLEQLGDAYAERLHEHHLLLRGSFERRGGVEVNTAGDAFFVVFRSASDALAAATEAQTSLAEAGPIRVRMGIHTGEPIRTEEGYVGMDVHRAARIAAAGHGGQVLLSRATYELVDPRGLRDLGSHRLKDVGEIHLYQVGGERFPPIAGERATNLPALTTALLGRELEQADILRLLREDDRRLVTLTGPGGIGKTRLAIAVAAELIESFSDGVWFIDLAKVSDPALVEPSIGNALGTTVDLASFLRGREVLLVIDNFEQVVGAADTVSRLLTHCPGVACLVTSREALRIGSEQEYSLRPLSETASVELFSQRARLLDPGFDAEEDVLVELCRRLDGIPLAIELAAARVRLLDPRQLLQRLDDRLPVLARGTRDSPVRHRTLEATIDWSYALLDATERDTFARLSVFSGGWTLEAAEEVCGADIDVLGALVEKSLVRSDAGRFDMFGTIHAYATERAAEKGSVDQPRRRHAAYYAAMAERAEPELTGREQHLWLNRLAADYDNFRSALDLATGADDDELALRLAAGLAIFWFLRGLFLEGLAWLDRVIDQTEGIHVHTRAAVLWGGGLLSAVVGNEDRSLMLAEQCLALARALDDGSMVARSLAILALHAFFRNDPRAARSGLEESIRYARRAGDAWCLADSLGTLASIYPLQGEFERSVEAAAEGLDIAQANDDRQGIRMNLFAIALCDARLGRLVTAQKAAEEGLAICRLIGDLFFCSYFLWILSLVATQTGDLASARAFASESLQIAEDIGAPLLLVCALEASAGVAHADASDDEAERLLVRAVEIGNRGMVPYSYVSTVHRRLGELGAARNDQATALRHLEESLSIARGVGDTWGVGLSESILTGLGD